MKLIKGYDYRDYAPKEFTRREWREEIQHVIKAGGYRRCEGGETFIHDNRGFLVLEIYANISS